MLSREESSTAFWEKTGSPRLGAVAYLNMLPFFAYAPDIELVPHPRALNTLAMKRQLDAACMSAIAGLSQGFQPIEPFTGVGAEYKVGSAFLEPIVRTQSDRLFWGEVHRRNINGLAEFGRLDVIASVSTPKFYLLTSGASEQSEWLFCALLAAQGLQAVVLRVPGAWAKLDPAGLAAVLEGCDA